VLGIKQLIVAVNKMDAVNFDHIKFDETKVALSTLLKNIGYKVEDIPFVPYSGWLGDNIKVSPTRCVVFRPTLLECFDKLTAPVKPTDKALRSRSRRLHNHRPRHSASGQSRNRHNALNETVVFMPSGAKGE